MRRELAGIEYQHEILSAEKTCVEIKYLTAGYSELTIKLTELVG